MTEKKSFFHSYKEKMLYIESIISLINQLKYIQDIWANNQRP